MLCKRLYLNKLIWTDCRTLSAGSAQCRSHLCDPVFNAYSGVLTDVHTVSKTDTAVFAHSCAAVESLYSLAGLNSVKNELLLCGLAVSAAMYNCCHLYNICCRCAKYSCEPQPAKEEKAE